MMKSRETAASLSRLASSSESLKFKSQRIVIVWRFYKDDCDDLSNKFLMQILLYGDKDFPDSLNKDIILLTLRFIHETGHFD